MKKRRDRQINEPEEIVFERYLSAAADFKLLSWCTEAALFRGRSSAMAVAFVETPVGVLTLFATMEGITRISFPVVRVSSRAPCRAEAGGTAENHGPFSENHPLEKAADGCSVGGIRDSHQKSPNGVRPACTSEILELAAEEIRRYFSGELRDFTVPVSLTGTPFQLKVWEAMLSIPFGEVATYGEIANAIGRPSATRAVGMACHANPVPIIVPCHRVVGKGGALTGFAPGLDFKRYLLDLEKTGGSDTAYRAENRAAAGS